ncbi:HD domain-containing phosphohydrolase [Burkholderiaceae bacterium UC74_6]
MSASDVAPPVVLFVDDEPSILSALRRLFRPEGYRVLVAEGGHAGLELLAAEPVDLVVSDMRMPEMDGAAFLEQVRLRWPEVGRILLTGYSDIGSTVAAINRGEIHRYIAKPWEERDLLLCVRDGLQRRLLERENRALQQLTQAQNDELKALNVQLESRVKARTQELEQVNAMLETSFASLEENFLLSIDVFSGLMELRQDGMAGYSRQVADLARRIARHLAVLDPGQAVESSGLAQDVYVAGLLHEIGKLGFPDALLRKPVSAMMGEEVLRFRRHTLNAEAALLPLGRMQRAARLIRAQHERFDGKGFPDGLAGADIPLGAQVLGLASDFFAAQSGRMAEKRYSASEAQSLILGGTGTRYAKAVVEAFQLALRDEPTREASDRRIPPAELAVGMVLSRDLRSPQGTLLLAAGFVFDAHFVRHVREFASREGVNLAIYVKLPQAAANSAASGFESRHMPDPRPTATT